MPRHAFFAAITLLMVAAVRAEPPTVHLVAPTEPLTPAEQQKAFHLPPGYAIELVASEPAIRKPMNLSFDAAGRLWVSQSIEYPFPQKESDEKHDTLRVFTDSNDDGVPDQPHVFAEGLNIPIGIVPVHDGVIAFSIPTIDHFRDSNGDLKADQRTAYYGTFGFKDTHGMASSFTWWLDGWVYACHGFNNDSVVKGADGHEIRMNSGNTYRFRADGSRIEQRTWGQVNPFGLAFDELGNLYSADCHSRPLYMLLRGAYYPSFGKPDDGLGFGPEMIEHSHESTGICGAAWYGAEHFPQAEWGTMFICNPVTGRINHDALELHGSSYKALQRPDFLVCDDPWFRPVDIKLAPDGSLYIADFYNRIIGHYEVPISHPQRDRERGRIWRISYTGEGGKRAVPPPDLLQASAAELVELLGHPNIAVRTQATHQLVHRIGDAADPLVEQVLQSEQDALASVRQRTHGLWVLERHDRLTDVLVDRLQSDRSHIVRTHLAKALAERPEWTERVRAMAIKLALDADAFVRRAAAEALGRHPDAGHVALLLSIWEQADAADTHLIHVARMALRDTLRSRGTPSIPADILRSPDRLRRLADVSLGLRNPDAAAFLLSVIERPDVAFPLEQQARYLREAVRYATDADLQKAIDLAVARRKLDVAGQVAILGPVQQALLERGGDAPAAIKTWQRELALGLLNGKTDDAVRQGLDVARDFRVADAADLVEKLAGQSPVPGVRLHACECLSVIDATRAVPRLKTLLTAGDLGLELRQRSADLLGGINSPQSGEALLFGLTVAPAPLQLSIARGLAGSKDGGESLLKAVSEGKAGARLLQDQVVGERLKGAKLERLTEWLAALTSDLPSDEERFQALLTSRRESFQKAGQTDISKGLATFTKHCAGCHRLENKGTKVGPDLDGVGLRGLDRILEDTLMPSRNVDQAFRATVLALKDGKTVTGLVQREEGEVVVVVNDLAKEVRVPKDEIDERRPLRLSPMPANLAEQLPVEEFHDLLGYLLSQKTAPVEAK